MHEVILFSQKVSLDASGGANPSFLIDKTGQGPTPPYQYTRVTVQTVGATSGAGVTVGLSDNQGNLQTELGLAYDSLGQMEFGDPAFNDIIIGNNEAAAVTAWVVVYGIPPGPSV